MSCSTRHIVVGARGSPLSCAQVQEVQEALRLLDSSVALHPIFVETLGDRDQVTSLRSLEKTDFFTREIDALQLSGGCRISIHSAKDLPDPLPNGLIVAALTRGLDPSDALVLREGASLESLPPFAKIATSSERREKNVKALRSDLECVDIRGNIQERLALLGEGVVDGVVVAEAALIRLNLTQLTRLTLPGERPQHQGQLAIVVREGDREMMHLFQPLDVRLL